LNNEKDERNFISIRVSRETYVYLNSLKLNIAHDLQSNGYFYNVSFDDVIQELLVRGKYDLNKLKNYKKE